VAASATQAPVVLLPGGALPAELAYAPLLDTIGSAAQMLAKDLEVYATETPLPGYSLDHEVVALLHAVDRAGFGRLHLVGYSAGGAVSLAFAAAYPRRLLSLALLEPAWSGNRGLGVKERALWDQFDRIMALPPSERIAGFVGLQLADGVSPPPPPPGPPPPWMAKRPDGLAALTAAFRDYDLDERRLRAFTQPVYYALGGRSNPDAYARPAQLAGLFPDFTLETYAERHHFNPPHRVEPDAIARALRQLWARGEAGSHQPAEA
jgi:pimeloyl-ACP methyl ester carboxylesterase